MKNHPHVSIHTVFDCVIPYIHDGDDRKSVSLVCRRWYQLDCITRKHVTVHLFYSPKPSRLHERFPFLESLTLKRLPRWFNYSSDIDMITPWIHEISVSFKCLKSLCIRYMNVGDSDLELLARTRGKDLRVLKIICCKGLSTDGLLHIGKCCNNLRTLCLSVDHLLLEKDGKWLHELALQNTGIESLELDFSPVTKYHVKDLILLAKNCSQSLVSLKLRSCALIDLLDVFRYVVRLEDFVVGEWDKNEGYGGFKFPPTMRCMGIYNSDLDKTWLPLVLPLAHQLRELYLEDVSYKTDSQYCFLIQRCPNLEILYIEDKLGDMGMKLLGQFCKKLRRYKRYGSASHIGLIALAQGCLALEYLHVKLSHITTEAIKCIGTHLKNLHDFRLTSYYNSNTSLPLDNGIRAMLTGCGKLKRLGFRLLPGELTDVGLGYIRKYGHNLRYLSLGYAGESDAGLVELSKGCPKLRTLEIYRCPFSKQAIVTHVFNMPSLRYMRVFGITGIKKFEMTRPNYGDA